MMLNDQGLASKRGKLGPSTRTRDHRSHAFLLVLCKRGAEIINQVIGMFEPD
jgi:hypothetical protein